MERQKYLNENGPRTNFNFSKENYFPLKVEFKDFMLSPIKYDSENNVNEIKVLELSTQKIEIDDSWNGFFSSSRSFDFLRF